MSRLQKWYIKCLELIPHIDEAYRIVTLINIIPYLSDTDLFKQLLELAVTLPEYYRADFLSAVVPHLKDLDLFKQALEIARALPLKDESFTGHDYRTKALSEIAIQLVKLGEIELAKEVMPQSMNQLF